MPRNQQFNLNIYTIVIALVILSVLGYVFNWGWTGLGPSIGSPQSQDTDIQRGKTLWDWLQLLIIPAVLAIGGYLFNFTISRNEQLTTKQRSQTERDIALDNQHEATLQSYIDKISELLLEKHLRESQPEDEVRSIARVRTLTTLLRLDKARKGAVLQFLHESKLINKNKGIINLSDANLWEADLFTADLRGDDLSFANLFKADLSIAHLDEADLSNANLSEADLSFATLNEANLRGAILYGANLYEAAITQRQLDQAGSLEGATMPNGSKHP